MAATSDAPPVDPFEGWVRGSYTYDGVTHETFRQGKGPGVVVLPEIPGVTPNVLGFGRYLADRGFTVVVPSLFGTPGKAPSAGYIASSMARACIAREYAVFALGVTTPKTVWCRALARDLHRELGGPGVGAVGMCLTGGFALAMLLDPHTVAPVLSQPSLPLPVGKARAAALPLSAEDVAKVAERVGEGCPVLGLRFTGDPAVGTRFDTLRDLLGANFLAVELTGREHSVLTEALDPTEGSPTWRAREQVLAFLRERLGAAAEPSTPA